MKKQKSKILVVLFMVLSVMACKTSVEDETTESSAAVVDLKMEELVVPEGYTFQNSRFVSISISGPPNQGFQILQLNMTNDFYEYVRLGAAFTDRNGRYAGKFRIPHAVSKLYIRFDRPGYGEVEAAVINGSVTATFDQNQSRPLSVFQVVSDTDTVFENSGFKREAVSGSTSSGTVTKNGILHVSDYDLWGVPHALEPAHETGVSFSSEFLEDLDANFPEYRPVSEHNPEYLEAGSLTDLVIIDDAEVTITFLHEGAGYRNSLGYFVYDTNSPPETVDDINPDDIVVALPNASLQYSGGKLVAGDRIKLVNPRHLIDGDSSNDRVFSAGLSIGWVLFPNGFSRNDLQDSTQYYSIPSLNPEFKSNNSNVHQADAVHAVFLLYDRPAKHPSPLFLLGFEDLSRHSGDNDFNDTMFAIEATPMSAIQTTGVTMPSGVSKSVLIAAEAVDTDGDGVIDDRDDYPDDPERARDVFFPSENTYNSLLFEDQWPAKGDYDFNDIVVDYRFKTTLSSTSIVRELTGIFILRATGAGYPNGFAFELPIPVESITAVTGQSDRMSNVFSVNANGAEESGGHSVIPVFDNAHREFDVQALENKTVNTIEGGTEKPYRRYEVMVSLAGQTTVADLGAAPFNPFMVVNGNRGREVHLVNFQPTLLADASMFLTENDDTSPSSGRTYVTTTGLPWAIEVASSIEYPLENIQFPRAYLLFDDWAISGGANWFDWHKDLPGYRDHEKLYRKKQ